MVKLSSLIYILLDCEYYGRYGQDGLCEEMVGNNNFDRNLGV